MTVAHVVSSASHASASFSVSQASFSWTHTTTTNPQGVLVFVFQGVSATDATTSVTYGGTTVPAVSAGSAADTATEPGRVKAFYLGSGVPTTDNPTVVVNRTNNTTTMWAVCVTVTAATDTEAFNPVLLQENGAYAEQSVNDGAPGVNSVRYAGAYYGGASPAPAGTNSTLLHSNDAGAYGWSAVRETTAGQGARLVGFTQATADDRAGVHLAIREAQPPSLPGFLDTTWVEPESHCNCKPIVDGNGKRYRIAESNLARGNHPIMGASSDGGITWAEVDSTGSDARTTQDLEGTWVMKDGTSFIALTTRDDTVWLDEFRMSDHATNPDTWGYEETVDSALSSSGVIQATSLVKLSNGDYQCFYSDLLNGANNQIGFKRRTGASTYTSKTTFNDGAVNVTAPKAVVGEGDVTYVFYKDNTADTLVYRTVSSTGTVSARTTVASGTGIASDTLAHTNPIYYDDGGVEVIGIAYIADTDVLWYREIRDGVLQTAEQVSTAAVTTNPGATDSQAAVAFLAVDATTVYALWSRLSDGDLLKRVRTLGSGWGAESTQWASGGGTGWYIYSDVVTEGTDVKLVYTYDWGTHVDDASNITYNEEVLRTLSAGVTLGLPVETDTAAPLTITKTDDLGIPSEADTAHALTVTKTVTLGLATETDTAATLVTSKAATLGLATEDDTAPALTATKTVTLGLPVETDTAHALSISSSTGVTLGLALETDTAPTLAVSKTVTLGLPVDTSTAHAVVIAKTATLGLPVETDTAAAVTTTKTAALGLAVETDTAHPISTSSSTGVTLGLASETETAHALTVSKTITLGLPVDTATAWPLLVSKTRELGLPLETGTALALAPTKTLTLGLPVESDSALSLQLPPSEILPTPASRTLTVRSEARRLVVEAETRTVVVAASSRTVIA